MKSENIALSVIKNLHLTEDPEFIGGGAGSIGSLLGFTTNLFRSGEPASEFDVARRALGAVEGGLTVKRVGVTYIIDINFQSLNPDRAAQVANAIADAYIADQLEGKFQIARRATVWLQDRLKELRGQASEAERNALDYKVKNNIVDAGGRLMNEQQLAELNSSAVQARANTAEAKARLDRVQQILSSDDPDVIANDSGTVTDTLHNDVINKLRNTYLDFRGKESEWSRRFGPNHLAAVNMRNQMREIRRSILDELRRIAETYKSDYVIAKAREDSVDKSLTAVVSQSQMTNQAQIDLRELESTAQAYRALHDNFLQRYMESVQQQSFPVTDARVITKASPPPAKSAPKSGLIMAVATLGGIILGVGAGMLREMSDRRFRTRRQVEALLHTDCLAVLPSVKAGAMLSAADIQAEPRRIVRDGSALWHGIDAPFSRFAEAIRNIKVAIDLTAVSRSTKVIGITSALPNEGKSTVAAALAEQLGQAGLRVLLIDCDLRNPSLSRKLAPNASMGWVDVITDRASLQDVIWTEPSTNLTLLPVVMKTRVPHTSEILVSAATKLLFEHLRTYYDRIVVDLPPLAPIVDARATTNLIDSYLFVIEWGKTKINVVEHALGNALEIHQNLLGVVLNKVNIDLLARYDGHLGRRYYNRYYGNYGYTE
jgi:succinoglycan biosynthesis transport protein ExoP